MSPIRPSLTVVALCLAVACASPGEENVQDDLAANSDGKADGVGDPGALISVKMSSSVGVLLDEVPSADRARVAAAYLAKPASFWDARARRQLEATLYRLVYRDFFYPNRKQLPLPPRELWTVTVGTPARTTVDGHDLVMATYTFSSMLLSDTATPAVSDKLFAKFGGIVTEPFVLPADPESLFERTGYACMDEEDFPPNSVDTENALTFFDQDCRKGSMACHVSLPVPDVGCNDALKAKVGRVTTEMKFERLAWSKTVADSVRNGTSDTRGAQLAVVQAGVEDNRLIYRYIPENSCSIVEGCVGGSGWRRLLQFTATVQNLGAKPAHIGDVSLQSLPVQHNMFEYSSCHQHMHFSHYGKFTFSGGNAPNLGSKKAFCLESTARYLNNETTPLTHDYTCHNQGIASGWGDDYIAGIECQWVDVTPVDTSHKAVSGTLTFDANPDRFICEGKPVLDAQGNFTFEPTAFRTESGAVVDRFVCEETPNWQADNTGSTSFTIPKTGSYVTSACTRGQVGPARNCDLQEQSARVACTPGSTVPLRCSVPAGAKSQAIRFCETSAVLGTALSCTYRESLANAVVESSGTDVTLTCPPARDWNEPGGAYSTFTMPTFATDARAAVTCVPR